MLKYGLIFTRQTQESPYLFKCCIRVLYCIRGTRSCQCVISHLVTKLVKWTEVARSRAAFQRCLLSPIFNPWGLRDSFSKDVDWQYAVFFFFPSDTYTCFWPIFLQQTFDWESGEIFSFCIRQWTTGIHHEIKGFGSIELNTDLRSAVLLGHCRDEILFRNGIKSQCFHYSQTQILEDVEIHRIQFVSHKYLFPTLDSSGSRLCLCPYADFVSAISVYLMTTGDIDSSNMTLLRAALFQARILLPLTFSQRQWPDVKHTFVRDEWHSFGAVDFKDIRHGQSPLTSASCCRWQTRLGFLSMPGILFTLSFLEFWKASEPPTQNHRA